MWREGFRLQLGVELDPDEPRVVIDLDDLGQAAVGRHARKAQARLLELVAVLDVDLVAVAETHSRALAEHLRGERARADDPASVTQEGVDALEWTFRTEEGPVVEKRLRLASDGHDGTADS